MLNRILKVIVAIVVFLGIMPSIAIKSVHAAEYVVAPQLATGYYHSSVLISDGTVWSWGRNTKGQLSHDQMNIYAMWPIRVKNLDRVKLIATSIMSNYAIKEDGTLWAWGLNENGQLGDGTLENRTAPVQVRGIEGVTAVSTGLGYHVLALKNDGTVWAWGRNDNGELGDGTKTQRQLPVEVTGLTDVVSLVNAGYHSLALKSDGTVWAWGRNTYGESGGGVTAYRTTPFQVSISDVKAIAAGDHHSVAVKEDGTVWTWGRNTFGTLGDGTTTNRVVPVQVVGIDHVKSVVGGTHFSYALKEDGTVWSWGINNYGQLGDGTTQTRLSPVQVSGLTDVVSIGAGGYNGTAMQSGGETWGWGYNEYGELGDRSNETKLVPVRNAAVLDVTPPTIANPVITPTDITETGVTLSWEKATDNMRQQAELAYQVYQIGSKTALTVSAIEAAGVRIGDYELDTDTKQVTGLYDGQTYHFIVIVKDTDGSKRVYNKVTIRTVEIPTYSVNYYANGGIGSAPIDNYVYYPDESVSVLGSGGLTRPGYTFAGWNTGADGNGTAYVAGAEFTMGAANVELFAQWTLNQTYTVTYNANSGAGDVPTDSNVYEQGVAVTVLGNTEGMTKSGHAFVGWNTQADGNGTAYAAGAEFTMGAANVELFAQWTLNPTYTVTYNANSGAGDVPTDGNAYEQGTTVTVLGNTEGLTKSGHSFVGWNTQEDGNGTAFSAGAELIMGAANVELFAQWTLNPTYTVTYNANSGIGDVPMDGNAYEQGTTVTVLGNTEGMTKFGHTFVGWNTQPDGNGTAYAAGAEFTMGAANVELFAQWTLDTNGGTSGGTPESNSNTENVPDELKGLRVTVSGVKQDLVDDVTITKENGQVVMTVHMDSNKWQAQLEQVGKQPEIIISITETVDEVSVVWTGDAVQGLEGKQGVLIIQTLNGNYKLPMEEIEFDSWSKRLGDQVPIADTTLHITLAKGSAAQIALLNRTANEEGFTVIGSPVDFIVTISYNGKSIELSEFNSYVEREIVLPDGAHSSSYTTAVIVEEDGTIRHMPTRFITREGKVIAVVSSLTNSTYVLIGNTIRFEDVESHWAKDAVNNMGSRMVARGADENHFNPDASITRAEFASILVRALGLADTAESNAFADVKSGAWYNGAVTAAQKYGIVGGYADGTFHPAATITREEAIVMIYRAMKLVGLATEFSSKEVEATLAQFVDGSAIHSWAEEAVVATVTNQLIQGTHSKLMLEDDITRAETVVIIQRMLDKAGLIDRTHP
ncbi:RCC1 domain-containing protein [Paenibacillus sp. strain BS8-2]